MRQFGSLINTHDHIWLLTSLVSRVRSPVHLNSLAFISTSGLVLLLLEAVSLVSLYGSIGISVYLLSSESPVFFLSQLSPLPTKIVVWPLWFNFQWAFFTSLPLSSWRFFCFLFFKRFSNRKKHCTLEKEHHLWVYLVCV